MSSAVTRGWDAVETIGGPAINSTDSRNTSDRGVAPRSRADGARVRRGPRVGSRVACE
jgi:hypothetical protein